MMSYMMRDDSLIKLPHPKYKSSYSIEEAIRRRSSVRAYQDSPLIEEEVSQLLWAGQGTLPERDFKRTSPSAGATYPLTLYFLAGNVEKIAPGLYKYEPHNHSLRKTLEGDIRANLSEAALGQEWILSAPANIIIVADYQRTTMRYGKRGIRYVWIEVGHTAENIYLQCESLGLGTVAVGAFDDLMVKKVLHLPPQEEPLYIMPIGKKI